MYPKIFIESISLPTNGSIGVANIRVSGNGLDVIGRIDIAPTQIDAIEETIRAWERAVGMEGPPTLECHHGAKELTQEATNDK